MATAKPIIDLSGRTLSEVGKFRQYFNFTCSFIGGNITIEDIELEVFAANVYSSSKNAIIKGAHPVFPRVTPVNDLLQAGSLEKSNSVLAANVAKITNGHKDISKALLGMTSRNFSGRLELTVGYHQLAETVRFFGQLLPRLSLKKSICLLPSELISRFLVVHTDISVIGVLTNLKVIEAQVGNQIIDISGQELARHALASMYFLQLLRGFLFTGCTLGQAQSLIFDCPRPDQDRITLDGRRMIKGHNFLPYTLFLARDDPIGRVDFGSATLLVPLEREHEFLQHHCLKALMVCGPRSDAFHERHKALFLKYSIDIHMSMRSGSDLVQVAKTIAKAYVESLRVEFDRPDDHFRLSREYLQEVYGGHLDRHYQLDHRRSFIDLVKERFEPSVIRKSGWSEIAYVRLLNLFYGFGNESFMAVRGRVNDHYLEVLAVALQEEGVEIFHEGFNEDIFWQPGRRFVQVPEEAPARAIAWASMRVSQAQRDAVDQDDRRIGGVGSWTVLEKAHLAMAYIHGECPDVALIKIASPIFAGRRTIRQIVEQSKNYRRIESKMRGRRADPFTSFGEYHRIKEDIAELRPRGFFDLPTTGIREHTAETITEFIRQSLRLSVEQAKARMQPNPILDGLLDDVEAPAEGVVERPNGRRISYQAWLDVCLDYGKEMRQELLEGRPAPSILSQQVRVEYPRLLVQLPRMFARASRDFWLAHFGLQPDEWDPSYMEYLVEKVRVGPGFFLRVPRPINRNAWSINQVLTAIMFMRRTDISSVNSLITQ